MDNLVTFVEDSNTQINSSGQLDGAYISDADNHQEPANTTGIDDGSKELPDWISDKYRSAEDPIEAQAKAYSEAQRRLATRSEDLRAELLAGLTLEDLPEEGRASLREAALAAHRAESGVPEGPDGYTLPEGVEVEDGTLRDRFFAALHKVGASQEQANELISLYVERERVDPEAIRSALGPRADERLGQIKAWGSRHIPKALWPTATRMLNSAEGVQLFEAMMGSRSSSGVSPSVPTVSSTPMTSAEAYAKAAEMKRDPRYRDRDKRDPAYVQQVKAMFLAGARLKEAGK